MDDSVVDERGLQPGKLLDGGAPPHALVGRHHARDVREDRDDLVIERTAVLRGGGPLMRQRRVLVEPGARESPLLRNHLRGQPLIE